MRCVRLFFENLAKVHQSVENKELMNELLPSLGLILTNVIRPD